ncbi:hypothetical protein Tco_1228318 [Tanacetum coccineum]
MKTGIKEIHAKKWPKWSPLWYRTWVKVTARSFDIFLEFERQVETELILEEKFRELCETVSNFVKESEDVVNEVERLSCKDVAKEIVRLLRRGQKCDLYKMTRLQMMVNESHLSVRKKHTFVSKMNLGTLALIVGASPSRDVQLPCKK